MLVCASVLLSLLPAAPPASPVAPALAPARGIIGLSYTAVLLILVYTMDSQPTDKVRGVGDDFVRGGQDKTPTKKKRNSYERTVVKADTTTVTVTEGNEQYSIALRGYLNKLGARLRLRPTMTEKRGA